MGAKRRRKEGSQVNQPLSYAKNSYESETQEKNQLTQLFWTKTLRSRSYHSLRQARGGRFSKHTNSSKLKVRRSMTRCQSITRTHSSTTCHNLRLMLKTSSPKVGQVSHPSKWRPVWIKIYSSMTTRMSRPSRSTPHSADSKVLAMSWWAIQQMRLKSSQRGTSNSRFLSTTRTKSLSLSTSLIEWLMISLCRMTTTVRHFRYITNQLSLFKCCTQLSKTDRGCQFQ